jgi:hypothetical protein
MSSKKPQPKVKPKPRPIASTPDLRPWIVTLRGHDGEVRQVMATTCEVVFAGCLLLRDDDGLVCAYPAGVWFSVSRPHADAQPDGEAKPRQTLHLTAAPES